MCMTKKELNFEKQSGDVRKSDGVVISYFTQMLLKPDGTMKLLRNFSTTKHSDKSKSKKKKIVFPTQTEEGVDVEL